MINETVISRVLVVLVFAPAGGLLGKSVADAAVGRPWWPWLAAALGWLGLAALIAVARTTSHGRLNQPR